MINKKCLYHYGYFDIKIFTLNNVGESPTCKTWPFGFSFHSVVVSTLDFESNNTSSNLVGSSILQYTKF